MLTGQEMLKMASVTSHPALRQCLYGAINEDEVISLLSWIRATCRVTWPNKGDVPTTPLLVNHGRITGCMKRARHETRCICSAVSGHIQ